jgi:hypothetical protein
MWREDHRVKALPAGQTGFGGRPKTQQTLDEVITAEFSRAWFARAHARQEAPAHYARNPIGAFLMSNMVPNYFLRGIYFWMPIFGCEKNVKIHNRSENRQFFARGNE